MPEVTHAGVLLHIEENVPLAPKTTLELGGPARFYCECGTTAEVVAALRWAERQKVSVEVLGGGSNVVVADGGFDGLILAVRLLGTEFSHHGNLVHVTASAGVTFDELVLSTVREGWQGLECLSGIPGLVGATPIQNVGAYGCEVADVLLSVEVVDRHENRIRILSHNDCHFKYRHSILKSQPNRFVVTAVTFALKAGAPPVVRYQELRDAVTLQTELTLTGVRSAVLGLRRKKSMVIDPHDVNRRSVGSFFMNPIVSAEVAARVCAHAVELKLVDQPADVPSWALPDGRIKLAAGWLIEKASMPKGFRRGQVGISTAHALALVHHGGGTTAELLQLAADIRKSVSDRFAIELTEEPVRIGTSIRP